MSDLVKGLVRLITFACLLLAPTTAIAGPPVYVGIVDAGSGGTRLFLYSVIEGSYPKFSLLYEARVIETPDAAYEADDGIDNYACFPGGDAAAKAFYATQNVNPQVMQPLWSGLKGALAKMSPPVKPENVRIKVYATAGMRSARETCGAKPVERLYKVIREGMAANGLTNALNEVRTIDGGSEEGLWAFIAANDAYRNSFGQPGDPRPAQAPVGMVEVGGSSVQVAYPTIKAGTEPGVTPIRINNKSFNVYSVSYLHLGQDDMRKALRDYKTANGKPVAHKCWALGFDKANDILDEGHAALSQNGAFNPADPACAAFMRHYLSTFMGTPLDLSAVNRKFVGLGGLKYTLDAFGLLVGPYAGANNLTTAVNTRCTAGVEAWPGINTDQNVQRFCPHGAYVASLLTDKKFGIFRQKPALFERVLLPADVGGKSLSWIIGYLLLTYSK